MQDREARAWRKSQYGLHAGSGKVPGEQSAEDRNLYESAESEARARKAGLWTENELVPLREWRSLEKWLCGGGDAVTRQRSGGNGLRISSIDAGAILVCRKRFPDVRY